MGRPRKYPTIEEIFDVNALMMKGHAIKLPSTRIQRVLICHLLYDIIYETRRPKSKEQAYDILDSITIGISVTTLKRYHSSGWEIIASKKKKRSGFFLRVVDKKTLKQVNTLSYSMGKLLKFQAERTPGAEVLIDPDQVLAIRNKDLADQEGLDIPKEKIEDVAREICEKYAGGVFNIIEACQMFKVRYLDFLRWVATVPVVEQMYKEAHALAVHLNQSRQLTLVDNSLIALLQRGYTETTTTVYEKVIIPTHPEGIMVPKGEKKVKKDISVSDLGRIKAIILNIKMQDNGIDNSDDPFANMTPEEIDEWIFEHEKMLDMIKKTDRNQ